MASGAARAADPAAAEPDFLTARRERAVRVSETLELPQFKGQPGWEFTDISGLDLDAYAPAPAPSNGASAQPPGARAGLFDPDAVAELFQVDAGVPVFSGELPDGVIVSSLESAAHEHPELVAPYLGSVVPGDDMFVVRNDAGFRGGAFVYVPAGVALERPILLTAVQAQTGTELDRRTLIVLETGAQAEVWEQYLSASDEIDGVFNTVVELVVGQNARLRFVAGQDLAERSWGVRYSPGGSRSRRGVGLGRARIWLGPWPGADGDAPRRPGR